MFNGGMGMTKPGAPVASGILASSQPLVDVLASQARDNLTNGINVGSQMYGSNVQGTNLMNQGGVANYAPGGISYTTNEAGDVVRIPVSGSQEEAEIVENEGLGMFAGLPEDQFKRSDAPGSFIGRKLQQGEGAVEFAWQQHIAKGGDGSAPLVLEDGTIIIGNPDGSGGQLYAKGRGSGQDIYETPLVTGLTKENIGMQDFPDVNIRGLAGDQDVVEKLDSEGQPIVEAEIIQQEKLPVEETIEQMKRIQSSKKDLADMIESGSTDTNVDVEKIFKDTTGKTDDNEEVVTKEKVIEKKGKNTITGEGLGMFAGLTEKDLADPKPEISSEEQRQKINDILKTADEKQSTQTSDNLLKTKIKEFTDAMPEYEGMSNDEKSFAIIKMGMAIAAGQSPNVIENISKGVLATIDEFSDDPKAKRKYEQNIKLSAAQYALQAVNNDEAQKRKDERTGVWMVDENDNSVFITNEMIVNGTLPKGITSEALEIANISALRKKDALVSTALTNARKEMLIDDTYKDKQQTDYRAQVKRFNDAEVGKLYIENAILTLDENTGDITGFRGGVKNMSNKVLRALGFENNKQWDSIDEMRKDVRLAFQKLIPVSLAGVQSANSISNRDVQFLADAYVDSAMLKDGSYSFVGMNETILRQRLQETIKLFQANQEDALSQITTIENNLASRILPGQSLEDFGAGKVSALEAIAAFKPTLLGTGTQGRDDITLTLGDITLTQAGVSDTGIPIWNPVITD